MRYDKDTRERLGEVEIQQFRNGEIYFDILHWNEQRMRDYSSQAQI